MTAISAEKRQQILHLAAEGHTTRHIHRVTGVDCETIRRYRNGYTPPPKRDPAAAKYITEMVGRSDLDRLEEQPKALSEASPETHARPTQPALYDQPGSNQR